MRVKYNKLFPYPVLNEETDDYKDNTFNVDIKPEKDINRILLKCDVKINDKKIEDMIIKNKLDLVYHVECAKNLFRHIYKFNKLQTEIYIDNKDLDGTVDICVFIVAADDIFQYKNDNFNEDYDNAGFDLNKGNIMGFYNVPRIYITKDTEELAKMSSIFTIAKKSDSHPEMNVDLDGPKIKIWLSEEDYKLYRIITKSGKAELQPVINSMIILPALIYAFDTIDSDEDNEYENCRWFIALDKVLKQSKIDLNRENIRKHTSLKLAQKLLNMPISSALANLNRMED